ncbi:ABC transporter substrate-binding protein [Microvirga tunisiensis]|uniref:ABC transporter substrate-binding protein n=2 Tax=Pannonibacter tanglangensis TaxID=2750084 RepID=A0ABW9ZLG7_9HYPH|nr:MULTISPECIES: extracellular solute-binding protein [unclassified Pannonibacter]NBN65770.1 ABC transporter substrate-binding protein [Pannonibacter sp. XCT-34]NBN80003.1 ABC transporter substrate-binding protein [Pannonibacter sp. XCT-53]
MTDHLQPTRRTLLRLSAAAAAAATLPLGAFGTSGAARAQPALRHGLSVFGELKYAPGFEAFEYVRRDAPKGGRISFSAPSWAYNQNPQTFNTFNTFILKGDAPPRMEMCFDSLMVRALDEPDAIYGLVAAGVEIAADGNSYIFHLRPEARFHDGSRLTADDVAFSLNLLKASGHPQISQAIQEFTEARALDEARVEVLFSGKQTRQLPLIVAGLPIFSRRYYSAYDFTQSTLTPPLSSGPYKVGAHEVGRFVEYHRVTDWWAQDLPVSRGQNNFDVIRLEFFRERQVTFEAFKKGLLTFHEEFTSKTWNTEYTFPAVTEGKVLKKEIPDNRPSGAQGWFFNARLPKFADPRVRRALGFAFDFEWSNQNLFYGMYRRTQSFFQNSDMMATGLPDAAELALLEPFRNRLPAEVFGEPALAPVSDGSGNDRSLLRQAAQLLADAGLERREGVLYGLDGKPFTIEFLDDSIAFDRVVQPLITNFKRLGIEATSRIVDPAQYQSRENDFDFEVTGRRFSLSATLSDETRDFWSSQSADRPGSRNLSGIKDPVVDALIDKALAASTRQDMVIAARALDRVLRAGHYWIPQWNKPYHSVAIWDVFGYPEKPPFYDFPVETTWWFDTDRAARIGMAG